MTPQPQPTVPAPDAAWLDPDDPHLPVGPGSRTWRRLDRITIAAFVLLLPIPALIMLAGVRPKPIENRPLLAPAPLSVEALGDPAWYGSLDRAIGDNVSFRPLAVKARARVVTTLGGSPNQSVVRGVGPWLFHAGELNPDCRGVTAGETVSRLDAARTAFEAAGQEFRFVMAPDKHSIYPDKRRPDDGMGVSCTETSLPALSAALDERTWAVNGLALLAAARDADPDGPQLFYAGDTHWTPTGALPTVRALVQSLDPAVWSEDDVVVDGKLRRSVDLARLTGLPRTETTPRLRLRPETAVTKEKVPTTVELANAAAILRFTTSGDRPVVPGRTAMVYDSFFGTQMAMVTPFFEETVWIHHGDLREHPELAEQLGPFDRVVLERVERGLYLQDVEALVRPLVAEAAR